MSPSAAQAFLESSPPARILVVQTAFLGDVIFTSPLVHALRGRFPSARLTLVVAPRGAPIARHIPGVDEVVVFDKRGANRSPMGLLRTAQRVPSDLALVPHPSWRSALLGRLSKPGLLVGEAGGARGALFDVAVARTTGGFVASHLSLGEAVGARGDAQLRLRLEPSELERARARLDPGRFVGAVIGLEWATKRLPAAQWGGVLDGLVDHGFTPVLLGAPTERDLAEAVLARSTAHAHVVDQVGDPLDDALATLGCCEVVIGGDTGLVHAARALGIPTVALFGPTDPRKHLWDSTTRVLSRGLPCQPCHAHGPAVCPLGHHQCMTTQQPTDIVANALALARAAVA